MRTRSPPCTARRALASEAHSMHGGGSRRSDAAERRTDAANPSRYRLFARDPEPAAQLCAGRDVRAAAHLAAHDLAGRAVDDRVDRDDVAVFFAERAERAERARLGLGQDRAFDAEVAEEPVVDQRLDPRELVRGE